MRIEFILIHAVSIVLIALMSAVEEQQERFKNDSNRSPKERDRAYRRYEFAKTMRIILPKLYIAYIIIYLILHIGGSYAN